MTQKLILGTKLGMSQAFNNHGHLVPVTAIFLLPCFVIDIDLNNNIVKIGAKPTYDNKEGIQKSILGFAKSLKINFPTFKYIRQFSIDNENIQQIKLGEEIKIDQCNIGKKIKISTITKGKGYTGNIKRHNFSRGGMGHGSKHHRLQGSLGSGTTPGRVFPGKRMSGHVGNKQRTISGLEIIDIDIIRNILLIKGCIPGKFQNLIKIYFPI